MKITLSRLIVNAGLAISMSESRRYSHLGAATLNGVVLEGSDTEVEVEIGDTLQVGRRTVTITQEHLS